MEGCLRLVEDQMLALSDRPYAPTARPTQTLLLVSTLVETWESATSSRALAGVYAVSLFSLCVGQLQRRGAHSNSVSTR